jgi:fucose 4-O-acetylase-like acetyltransferase
MKKRLQIIDELRMLAMVLVIYQHVNGPYVLYVLAFHMPIFFIITGFIFTLGNSWETIKIKDFIIKRAKVILVANYSFILINIVLNVIIAIFTTQKFSIDIKTLFLLGGNAQGFFPMTFWFLPILFFSDILFMLALKNMTNVAYFTVTSLLFSYILTKCPPFSTFLISNNLSRIFMGCFFIGVGYIFSKQIRKLILGEYHIAVNLVVSVIGLIGLIVFCNLNYSPFYMVLNSYGNYIYAVGAALAGSAMLIALVRYIPKVKLLNQFLAWGGRNTLALFPIHVTYLVAINYVETKLGFQMKALWLINLIILCLVTFVTTRFVEKYVPFIAGKGKVK